LIIIRKNNDYRCAFIEKMLRPPAYFKEGALPTMRAALNRLKIRWEPSSEELDYQAGKSTQIPANPTTKIKDRFRRQLRYRDMELTRG
jgi:hypothetical protein